MLKNNKNPSHSKFHLKYLKYPFTHNIIFGGDTNINTVLIE
jgi:hypothetical protein